MNLKNFLVAGIVGGIVDFLLGWLFYGVLFYENFGSQDPKNMPFIALGCLSFGMFVSFIYTKWAGISTLTTGASAGAVIGIFMGLVNNFFMNAMNSSPNYKLMLLDIGISIIMGSIIGAVIGMVLGKMK